MILAIVLGFFLVSVVIGFGMGWYVRGAYVRRYMRLKMKERRQ